MQKNHWTLIDKKNGVAIDRLDVSGADINTATAINVEYRRLSGGRQEGLHLLSIDNGSIRVSIIPERGMGIWKAWSDDVELGWQSPIDGPVHPNWVPLHEPSGLGWLDGFDELLVRCGLHSNGAPEHDANGQLVYPLHGKIAQSPAHHLELQIDRENGDIVVRGIVDEKRFLLYHLQLTITLKLQLEKHAISLSDQVTNLGATDCGMQMLYHINFGHPVLNPGAELILPVKQMAPRDLEAARDGSEWSRYDAALAGYQERVHFFELLADAENQTRILLKNSESSRGVSLRYDITQLPYFVQWKHTGSVDDGYVTGLEPATNFPNPRSFEESRDRVVPLGAGQSRQFDLYLEYHPDAESVKLAQQSVEKISEIKKQVIHDQPLADWSFEVS